MSFEMNKAKLLVKDCAEKMKTEQTVEIQIDLPDYCAEVKRILKCVLLPGVHSVSRTGDRVSARGNILVRVIYLGEKDKIDCYEKNLDLAVSTQMKNITDDMMLTAKSFASYVNCRAASQRKITVNGAVGVIFKAFQVKKSEIPFEIVSDHIECLKKKIKAENLVCMGEKTFDIGETVALPKELPDVSKILRSSAYATVESLKAVSGKLLIKGDCVVQVAYLPRGTENKVEFFLHSMPISQIIDLDGVEESSKCSVNIRPSLVTVNVKNDSDDEQRLIEFALRLSSEVSSGEIKEYEIIEDCYGTQEEIEAEYTVNDMLCPVNCLEKSETVRQTVDISSSVRDILDIWVGETKTQMQGEDDKAKGCCKINLCILYLDEKDVPVYTEKEVEFLSEIDLKEKYEGVRCDFTATVKKIEWTKPQKGKTEIKAEIAVKVKICSICSYRTVASIKESSEKRKGEEKPALTLYFCDEGEKVWDIAKKYRTTCAAVIDENSIEGDFVKQSRMLLIPSV